MDALLCIICFLIVVSFYAQMKKKLNYWTDRGVAHLKPLPIFGNVMPELLARNSICERMYQLYCSFPDENFVGYYNFLQPVLIVRDTNAIESILVKDFHFFTDHDIPREDKSTLANLTLFNLSGDEWRGIRNKVTPTFSSGKLKYMINEILSCVDCLMNNIEKNTSEEYELKSDLFDYSLDVTSNVIFGMQLKQQWAKKEFREKAKEVFNVSFYSLAIYEFTTLFPKFSEILGVKLIKSSTENYFRKIINETFEQRRRTDYRRRDYVQLLLRLKEKGSLEIGNKEQEDDYLEDNSLGVPETLEITDDLLAAQAFQFLTAGFEPVHNAMTFTLFELSRNPDIQNKVREEIRKCLLKNKSYSYTALKEMIYLEQCIQETLRIYPVVPFLMRRCVKDYTTSHGLTIEKGTPIFIPLLGIHRDENYFPNPEIFDPDRFHADSSRSSLTYLPFGAGPRMCIGMRFAMLKMKLGIARILEKYEVRLSHKTKLPLKIKSSLFLTTERVFFDLKKL